MCNKVVLRCCFCVRQVCELDIIFNFEKAYFILDEFLMGGEILETSKVSVGVSMEEADTLQEVVYHHLQVSVGCKINLLMFLTLPSADDGGVHEQTCLLSLLGERGHFKASARTMTANDQTEELCGS